MPISSKDARRQRRGGSRATNPGRYVKRELPEPPGMTGTSNAALAPLEEIMRRAEALGIATTDRRSGHVARDVALAEALAAAGAATEPAAGEGSAVERAAAAVAAGVRPEAAILSALAAVAA